MIEKLEMFMALARERHFGRAAEACHVSQPSLSAAIKQLEGELGVQLVRRGSRYQGLTDDGERVLEWARRIVADARAMKSEIQTARHGLSGHLRLAVIPTALAMIHDLTTAFAEAHPGVRFTVLSRTSQEILSMIENLEIDIGVTYLDNEPLGRVATVPLYVERYTFITADPELFPGASVLTWQDAATVPLCLLTPNMQNRRIVNAHFREAGVNPTPVLESDSIIAMLAHVSSGRWSAIMADRLAHMFARHSDIRVIPLIEPELPHMVGIVVQPRDPYTPLIAAFLRLARNMATQMSMD